MNVYLAELASENLGKLSNLIDKMEFCQDRLNHLFDKNDNDEEATDALNKYQDELREKRAQLEFSRQMLGVRTKAYKDEPSSGNEELLNDQLSTVVRQLTNPALERFINNILSHVSKSITDEDLIRIGDDIDMDSVKHSFNLTRKFLDFITKDRKSSEIISRWLNSNQ